MKYLTTLPLTALIALTAISLLVHFGIIPSGMTILDDLQKNFGDYFFTLIFLIILAESIVYVGFYFPGQFFAVVLVVLAEPDAMDIVYLTLSMVAAATLGSLINYTLGHYTTDGSGEHKPVNLKQLLMAMIHINSLAFFMFAQGSNRQSIKIVGLAGLLNLPYYLLLIFATSVLSEEVMQLAENAVLLFVLIGIWLVVALVLDIRKYREKQTEATAN